MAQQTFADLLGRGKALLGLCNMYPAAGIIEGMCSGWDFVWIDGQHGQIEPADALAGIRTARGCGLLSLLRVPGHDASQLGRAADLRADGYMVPMVNSAAEARAVVAAMNFPPLGVRSYGGRRPIDLAGRGYYQTRPFILAQIETPQAVENVQEILAVDGVDGLFFGPDDMKTALGLPIDHKLADEPALLTALDQTAAAARKSGKWLGTVAADVVTIELCVRYGCRILVCGADAGFLRASAGAKLAECRTAIAGPSAQAPGPEGGTY